MVDCAAIVFVMPVYKHSVLVIDAIDSFLRQRCSASTALILVNDGCPHAETQRSLLSFAQATSHRIDLIKQLNSGLSAARNCAIDYALHCFPKAEGIYFLDADNFIHQNCAGCIIDACSTYPDADWFFPDVLYTGLRKLFDYRGDYSILDNMAGNICEAGSFVRMRVFRAGVRFDECMRLGYEDWDFWLQAHAKGFTGKHLPNLGLRYRKRAESMVSDSVRDHFEIVNAMRRKHNSHLSPRRILNLEATERPRFCFISVDEASETTYCQGLEPPLTIGAFSKEISCDDIAFGLHDIDRGLSSIGFLFSTSSFWIEAHKGSFAHNLLWEVERLLNEVDFVFIGLQYSVDFEYEIVDKKLEKDEVHLIATSSKIMKGVVEDVSQDWIRSRLHFPNDKTRQIIVKMPTNVSKYNTILGVVNRSLIVCDQLKEVLSRFDLTGMHNAREVTRVPLWQAHRTVREWLGASPVFPRVARDDKNIAFVLPVASFGGVEKIAHNRARALSQAGFRVHLIVIGPSKFLLPPEFAGLYDTIRLLRSEAALSYDWEVDGEYYGSPLSKFSDVPLIVGLCADMDLVINCHSAALHVAAGRLRRLGIATACSSHVFDVTTAGRQVGHPFSSLAYEHAYDIYLPESHAMGATLHALGVPSDKILVIPNACGFEVKKTASELRRARMGTRSAHLRCLFIGRLDRQKGVDILAQVIQDTLRQPGPIYEWRVIGKPVLEDQLSNEIAGVEIEEPLLRSDDISRALEWADVVVMPSYFEGLPLSAIEAMRAGAVLIATDVGALNEVVEHDYSGFLFSLQTFRIDCGTILNQLAHDRGLMNRIGADAARVVESRNWSSSIAPLLRWLNGRRKLDERAAEKTIGSNPRAAAIA